MHAVIGQYSQMHQLTDVDVLWCDRHQVYAPIGQGIGPSLVIGALSWPCLGQPAQTCPPQGLGQPAQTCPPQGLGQPAQTCPPQGLDGVCEPPLLKPVQATVDSW